MPDEGRSGAEPPGSELEARKQAAGWQALGPVSWITTVLLVLAVLAGLWQSTQGASPLQLLYTLFIFAVAGALMSFRASAARNLRRAAAARLLGPALAAAHPDGRVDADAGLPAAEVVAALGARGISADPARVYSSALATATVDGALVRAAWVRAGRAFRGVLVLAAPAATAAAATAAAAPRVALAPDEPAWLRPDRAPPVSAAARAAFVARFTALAREAS